MHVLIVSTSSRSPWFEVARAALESDASVSGVTRVLADGRTLQPPRPGDLVLAGTAVGDLRYVDLVLAYGERSAGWAALPWALDELDRRGRLGPGPILVLADTVVAHGGLAGLVEAAAESGAAVRARSVDRATGLPWGGGLPGALALGSMDAELLGWWRGWVMSDLTEPVAGPAQDAGTTHIAGQDALLPLWRDLPTADAVGLLADPGFRLAACTAGHLEVSIDDDGQVFVDDEPLVLIDVDGFDPAEPWWFAPPGASPERFLSDAPALRTVLRTVGDRLLERGWDAQRPAVAAVPGVPETPSIRAWYRSELRSATERSERPPNPYVCGEVDAFLALLAASDSASSGVSVFADLVFAERPDLRSAFAAVRWSGRDPFIRWMWSHGLTEGDTALAVLPPFPQATSGPARVGGAAERPFGVNLVGYLTGELGLGVAARRMQAALESVGVPVATVSYDRTSSRQAARGERVIDAPYLVNLLVITPDQLPFFVEDVGPSFFEGHHNVGLWYWETDVLTDRQQSSFAWVDEVWGATHYLCDVFERYDRARVEYMPVPLVFEDPSATPEDRRRLGLDDRFTVLFSFDFLSVVDRKNPLGLVQAFTSAFAPEDGARLILKGINGELFPEKLEQLHDAVADRPDIEVWDRYLTARDRLALVASVDCYASLHRSEGLGLTMAEAMALGTPVVATAYSGNLDFMDERSALLVPAEEVLIGPGHLYPEDGHWAAPDLDVAAKQLRRLFEEPGLRASLAAEAVASLDRFTVDAVSSMLSRRLEAIRVERE